MANTWNPDVKKWSDSDIKKWIKHRENDQEDSHSGYSFYVDGTVAGKNININIGHGSRICGINVENNMNNCGNIINLLMAKKVEFYEEGDPNKTPVVDPERIKREFTEVLSQRRRLLPKRNGALRETDARKHTVLRASAKSIDALFQEEYILAVKQVEKWFDRADSDVEKVLVEYRDLIKSEKFKRLTTITAKDFVNKKFSDLERDHPRAVYAVIDICYNGGPGANKGGLETFRRLRAALKIADYQWAANECRHKKAEKTDKGAKERGDKREELILSR